jgi:hypothetical protein
MTSCEREVSDDAVLATFPNTAEVYTDNPVGLTDEFFISIDPLEGANPEAFNTDDNEAYLGSSSIRIDVPSPDNPDGSFVGGIFRDRGEGRNLTEYDALTFWAKGTVNGSLSNVGFGTDFLEDKFPAARQGVELTTNWKKYIVPIPDASKLTQERGMFFFTAGGFDIIDDEPNGNEVAWTFWLDEIKFEKLGTLGQPRPSIVGGENIVLQNFIGGTINISDLTQTFNSADEGDIDVNASPAYFEFESSEPDVATVNSSGQINVIGEGSSTVTATLGDNVANGSITIQSLGNFDPAPTPTRDPSNVISIFSDAYQNVPVDYYNGFFTNDGQTTQGGVGPGGADLFVDGDGIINYTNLNFVGIGTFLNVSPVNASAMTHIHVDLNINEQLDAGDNITLELINDVGGNETSGSVVITAADLAANEWRGFDVPLDSFTGLSSRAQIGLIFFSSSTISNIYVDNIYYYIEE